MEGFAGSPADAGFTIHVQFETLGDHDNGLRAVSVFPDRKFQRLSSVDKEAAPQPVYVLNHPVAATVLADQERSWGWTACRGRFTFFSHESCILDAR